jgi:ribose 5-phosphate isomerase
LRSEKIVARASAQTESLIQSSKLVTYLGETAPLSIETIASGLAVVQSALSALGLDGAVRLNSDGTTYKTDNGNPIIDTRLPRGVDVMQLGAALDGTAGIVGHGLLLTEADIILIENNDGRVSRRARITRVG